MGNIKFREKNKPVTKGGSLPKSRGVRIFSEESRQFGSMESDQGVLGSEVPDSAPLRVLEQWREALKRASAVGPEELTACAAGSEKREFAPEVTVPLAPSERLPTCGSSPFFEFPAGGLPGWKRAVDIILVLISLPVWLPIMLVTAILIRWVSPGPAFYRQERIGQKGRRFTIFKFRSMDVDCDTVAHERYVAQLISSGTPMSKLDASDKRIIRGGRLLRASGLDELPQLFNVLRGEMSLVGPRPCTVREFAKYQPWQCERVATAPGLTGYWQVQGKNLTTFPEMVAMDIYYARNLSLKLDLQIILQTLPALWKQVSELQAFKAITARRSYATENGSETKKRARI